MRTCVRWVLATALIMTGCGPASGGRSGAGGASSDAGGSSGSSGPGGTSVAGSGSAGAGPGAGGTGTGGARDSGIADSNGDADAVETTVYVSPGGSDDNPGTAASPVQTLQRAQQLVRKSNANMASDSPSRWPTAITE